MNISFHKIPASLVTQIMIAVIGYYVYTIDSRMNKIESRMDKIEDRITQLEKDIYFIKGSLSGNRSNSN